MSTITAERLRELLNYDPETGKLTWKLDVPAGKEKKVKFDYKVIYPKAKKVILLARWPISVSVSIAVAKLKTIWTRHCFMSTKKTV